MTKRLSNVINIKRRTKMISEIDEDKKILAEHADERQPCEVWSR
nr:MAG TPA_asm: hypothetical protein [Caudoviricetes sp.]